MDSLSITDIDTVNINGDLYILVTDANQGVILFRFTPDGAIEDIKIVGVQGSARQFDLGPEGTWLIALHDRIIEASFAYSSG